MSNPQKSLGFDASRKPSLDIGKSIVRPNSDDQNLTSQAYGDLVFAQDYFNLRLFGGELQGCILAFARLKNVLGYFCADRFQNLDGQIAHEMTLNPQFLRLRSDRDVLGTLVHEMAHHWRHDHGPLNRRGSRGAAGYHDKVWAAKMLELGLLPTTTGKPGGAKTGYSVTHLIVDEGPFDRHCRELLANGFRIRWGDRPLVADPTAGTGGDGDAAAPAPPPKRKKRDRLKFTCDGCGLRAWAKPSAPLICGHCRFPMTPSS